MTKTEELEKLIGRLEQMTGMKIKVTADTPKEIETAIEQVKCLCSAYREKYDRNHFLKELLNGHAGIIDERFKSRAGHFGMEEGIGRRLYLMQCLSGDEETIREVLNGLYPSSLKTILLHMEPGLMAVILPEKNRASDEDMLSDAKDLLDTINAEAMVSVRVAYGYLPGELSNIPESYRKARLALEVGRLFYPDRYIFSAEKTGVGGLLYQLPEAVYQTYLYEVFGEDKSWLDAELMDCISQFLDNNLNISVTARKLFMHRNTLSGRIELVLKKTGLDVRNFDDAMLFKIAMMILSFEEKEKRSLE